MFQQIVDGDRVITLYITVVYDAICNPYGDGAAFTSVNNLKSVLRLIFMMMKKFLVTN